MPHERRYQPAMSRKGGKLYARTAEGWVAEQAGVEEAFVIYRPTGQIMWALVDGGDQDEIILRIAGVDYDLLA